MYLQVNGSFSRVKVLKDFKFNMLKIYCEFNLNIQRML